MTLRVKRGDTWVFDCVRTSEYGVPVNLTNIVITSEIESHATRENLSVTVTDAAAGAFRLSLDAAVSKTLAPAVYQCDVEFVDGNVITSTETFTIEVVKDITGAG